MDRPHNQFKNNFCVRYYISKEIYLFFCKIDLNVIFSTIMQDLFGDNVQKQYYIFVTSPLQILNCNWNLLNP